MGSFNFLDLPFELQDKVLDHHFGALFDLRITQHVIGAHSQAEVGHHKVYATGDPHKLCVLRTSRAVHQQALRLLHRKFTGHLDLSSVQYSSKSNMSGMSVPIPPSLPQHLVTSITLGKSEWRQALTLPTTFPDMTHLQTINFGSSSNGLQTPSFRVTCKALDMGDFAAHFHAGELDDCFLEVVQKRAARIWQGRCLSAEMETETETARSTPVRWEMELVGENCTMVDGGFVAISFTFTSLNDITVTRRRVVSPHHFQRSCEICIPECYFFGSRGSYCYGCTDEHVTIDSVSTWIGQVAEE